MKVEDLLAHRAQLVDRLEAIDLEKGQIGRKLKALDVLLEGSGPGPIVQPGSEHVVSEGLASRQAGSVIIPRRRPVPPHTVRYSPRTSLIDAVQELALKQIGVFNSLQLLEALQGAYPEFNLTETKHISSPLSDLVKRGVLKVERERSGSEPNIYRAANNAK